MIGIILFSGIIIALLFSKNRPKKIRMGERMLFLAIILGVVVAVIIAAMQMLGGILF